jgi:hypothetical protein
MRIKVQQTELGEGRIYCGYYPFHLMLQAPIDSALDNTHLVSVSLERSLAETSAKP